MRRRVAFTLIGVAIIAGCIVYAQYASWSQSRHKLLADGAHIAQTSVGQIEYSLRGNRGSVLLYIHGTPGGHDLIPAYFPDTIVLAPSRPGYLRTPLASGRTPIEQANAYAALLDELGIGAVFVLGTSGGGPSAIAFAGVHSDRTLGLIALQAVTRSMDTSSRIPAFLESDFLYWSVLGTLNRLRGVEGLVDMRVTDPNVRARILDDPAKLEMFESDTWSMWPVSQRKIGWENDMLQGQRFSLPLGLVTAPTLIIHGSADSAVPVEHATWLAEQVEAPELHLIEGADHNMPIAHFEEVNELIQQFISRYGERKSS